MTLQDLFDDLTFGELSQIHLGGGHAQGVQVEEFRHLVTHVNRGLTALHSRFQLKEGVLNVPLEEGVHEYALVSETLPVVLPGHVLWPEGLPDDITPPPGVNPVLPLNDESSPLSVYTPNHKTLRVPGKLWDLGVRDLTLVYRADHPEIGKQTEAFAPDEIEVDLPEAFREPLIYYIASRVINPIGVSAGGDGFHEGNNYAQKYEQSCRELEQWGYDIRPAVETTRFERNGFV